MVSPAEFWDMCNAHDWHYLFSDDATVYKRGYKSKSQLVGIAINQAEVSQIYTDFWNHFFSDHHPELPPRPLEPEHSDNVIPGQLCLF